METYVCAEMPNLRFALVVGDKRKRFQFKNGQLMLDKTDADALDAVVSIEGHALKRLVKKVDRERAEEIARSFLEQQGSNQVTRGGVTAANIAALRGGDNANLIAQMEADGASEEEIAKTAKEFASQESLLAVETAKPSTFKFS